MYNTKSISKNVRKCVNWGPSVCEMEVSVAVTLPFDIFFLVFTHTAFYYKWKSNTCMVINVAVVKKISKKPKNYCNHECFINLFRRNHRNIHAQCHTSQ